jgi:glucose-6-phosphate-specific signal transduction histidine kinase
MTSAQRLALYRTAQEGLTNIQRHAAAHQAWLRLACSADRIALQVSDDGRGLAAGALNSGFGLRGLRERATQLDGTITLDDQVLYCTGAPDAAGAPTARRSSTVTVQPMPKRKHPERSRRVRMLR